MYCRNCGKEIPEDSNVCPYCGISQNTEGVTYVNDKDQTVAGLLAIFLGSLGIHKFYLGYKKEGITMLLVSILTLGIGAFVVGILALIEGITYLTMDKDRFTRTYINGYKGWL